VSSRASRARIALGALALVAILFLFVFPTRSYIEQRRQVSKAEHDVNALKRTNAALAQEAQQLQSKSVLEGIARDQFNLGHPGEEIFKVLPRPAVTTTTVP
jgi:cell division protein FtsB